MKHILLILLTAMLSMNIACSKKKSDGVATAPITPTTPTPTNPTYPPNSGSGYIPGLQAPLNNSYYAGIIGISNRGVYKNFLKSVFGYQSNYGQNGYYGDQTGYSYSYSYSCDINIFRWFFEDNLVNCGSSSYQNQFDDYLNFLTRNDQKAMIQFAFQGNGVVKGLFLAGAERYYNYQKNDYDYYAYENIRFEGRLTQLSNGQYVIQAGPLAFYSTSTPNNFDVVMDGSLMGNVTIL
jgi:hypothetical protein